MDSKLKKLYDEFDPVEYVKTYFLNPEEGMERLIAAVHTLFSSGLVKGTSLLDVGTGPDIGTLISGSKIFSEIYASDYNEKCRNEVKKWVAKDPAALDWSQVFEKVAAIEGKSAGELVERLRKTVKDVFTIDILIDSPLGSVKKTFDAVQSFFVLEAVASNEADVKTAIKNMTTLLNKGGVLVLGGIAGATGYSVGSQKYPAFALTPDLVKEAVSAAGLTDINVVAKARENPTKPFDGDTYYFITGVKK